MSTCPVDYKSPFIILGVFPEAEDRTLLRNLFACLEFELCLAETFEQTSSLIKRKRFDLIVTDGCLSETHSWRHVLEAAQQSGGTPVIVAVG